MNHPESETVEFKKSTAELKRGRKRSRKGAEKGAEKLSINEKVVYRLVKENPYASRQAIMEKTKMTKKTVEYNIAKLKSRGF